MVNRQCLQTPRSKMNEAAGNVDYLCSKYLTEMSVVATIADLAVKEAEKPPPLHAAPPTPREDTPPPRMGVIPLGFGPDVPDQPDEETKLLFGYLRESKSESTPNKKRSIATSTDSPVLIRKQRTRSKNTTKVFPKESRSPLHQATAAQRTTMSHPRSKLLPIKSELQQLIKNADYSKMADFLGDILLNIHDIGGQPGFLEMLPALSTGPAIYLVFLDLSKELDKLYKIPFSRDGMEIIPFNSVHTTEATISQILTSIASVHCISRDPTPLINVGRASDAFKERITTFKQVKPVAALIGTHKDKLTDPARQIREKNEALEKFIQKFPEIIQDQNSRILSTANL